MHVVRITQPGNGQVRVHVQQLQVARGDPLPLHRVRRLRPVRALPREGGSSAQDGEARPRHRRGLVARRHEAGQPAGGAQAVHPALHPVAGARLPVSRRQLPPAVLPEDEARRHAHQDLPPQDQGRLPHLQAAHRAVLLPRQALPGDQVLRALLQQHQAEAQAAAGAATRAAGQIAAPAYGSHEHARSGASLAAAYCCLGFAATFQARYARAATQCAEGAAAGMLYKHHYLYYRIIDFSLLP